MEAVMGEDLGLISGGNGGYVNLSSPSSSEALANPYTSSSFVGGSPSITFSGGSTNQNSILEIGLLALAVIFIMKELA
jgi:hypothetical protein